MLQNQKASQLASLHCLDEQLKEGETFSLLNVFLHIPLGVSAITTWGEGTARPPQRNVELQHHLHPQKTPETQSTHPTASIKTKTSFIRLEYLFVDDQR